MNLQLSLKIKWFEITKSKVKPEDYREITPYWCNRLLLYKGYVRSKKFWENIIRKWSVGSFACMINDTDYNKVTFKKFDYNIMTLGYPKSNDTEKILQYKHAGIEIREGNPDWGAVPGKLYFVIKHGKRNQDEIRKLIRTRKQRKI